LRYYVADWCFSPSGADLFGVFDVCQFNFNWLKCLGVLEDHVCISKSLYVWLRINNCFSALSTVIQHFVSGMERDPKVLF